MVAMTSLAFLSIHGIGTQRSDFAELLHARLEKQLSKLGFSPYFESVYWADELDGMEHDRLRWLEGNGAKMTAMRRLAVGTLADAVSYVRDEPIVNQVQHCIASGLERLYAPWRGRAEANKTPLFVLAHSLGCLQFSDYLQSAIAREAEYGLNELRGFITFGCNIPLFALGRPFHPPPLRNADWVNLWDPYDFLGCPMSTLPEIVHAGLASRVLDQHVDVSPWWTRGPGPAAHELRAAISHMSYFNDRSFARNVRDHVVRLMRSPVKSLVDTNPDALLVTP
jgi:hypothetical protein